jgi:hypothetical protein
MRKRKNRQAPKGGASNKSKPKDPRAKYFKGMSRADKTLQARYDKLREEGKLS